MYIEDMFHRVLTESGQFLLDDHEIELDEDRFAIIVKSVCGTCNKYIPPTKKFNISITGASHWTFLEADLNTNGIPEWISDLTPVRLFSTAPHLLQYLGGSPGYGNEFMESKCEFPFEYRKPTVFVPASGTYDITAVYKHQVICDLVENKKKYQVLTVDDCDDTFFDLLRARMLKALGRSRRAFTLQDLPIENDAVEMVADGKELEDITMERFIERDHKFHLAWT